MGKKKILSFGKLSENKGLQAHLLIQNAQSYYIAGRIILVTGALRDYRTGFSLMHHSIECFLKAFLFKENIEFKRGMKGHGLTYLVNLGYDNPQIGDMLKELYKKDNVEVLLKELESNYTQVKYNEVGFNANKKEIIDIFDYLTQKFLYKFHEFYDNKKKEPSIFVSEELVDIMERDRQYPILISVMTKD